MLLRVSAAAHAANSDPPRCSPSYRSAACTPRAGQRARRTPAGLPMVSTSAGIPPARGTCSKRIPAPPAAVTSSLVPVDTVDSGWTSHSVTRAPSGEFEHQRSRPVIFHGATAPRGRCRGSCAPAHHQKSGTGRSRPRQSGRKRPLRTSSRLVPMASEGGDGRRMRRRPVTGRSTGGNRPARRLAPRSRCQPNHGDETPCRPNQTLSKTPHPACRAVWLCERIHSRTSCLVR